MRAKRKLTKLLLLAGLLASSDSAHAGNCKGIRELCDSTSAIHSIPVKIYRNFLVVAEGQIGGSPERQNFVLDTGTAPSVLDVRLVKKLRLATMPAALRAAGKTMPSRAALAQELAIGPIHAVRVAVRAQDLSWLERDLGMPVAGIIGLDVLSKSSFHLDYDRKEIDFGEVSREGIPVRYNANSGLAVAEVLLGGKPVRMLVDTGSDRVLLFGGNFAEARWLALRNSSQSGRSLADQEIHLQEFSAPDIILGGQHFRKDQADFVPGRSEPEFDGLLGVRALGFGGLSYDQASETIFLQK